MLIQHLFQGECHLFERSEIAYIVVHPQNKHNWGIYVKHLNYATFQDKPIKILLKLLQGEGIKEIEGLSVFNYIIYIYIYNYIVFWLINKVENWERQNIMQNFLTCKLT